MRNELHQTGAMPCMELFTLDEFNNTISDLGLSDSIKTYVTETN